ncbi:MAG: hypothetical protein A3B79_07320 [Deltaproteobacteria bacterium RIFCSPHIGHO2_02_FULL_50_15]|nr:MAG: hypothetical protein A3B79_07320 [Deltaproteobacteria bacterium RIFCSPHIGHO2_02_FULL_50_15]
MYVIDPTAFLGALKQKGYRSIGELAHSLGIHRNTIHHYLSGHPVLPGNFSRLMEALNLKLEDALIKKGEGSFVLSEEMATLVDQLYSEFSQVSFLLFGSRAQGRAHKYSDWDLGLFSQQDITHRHYIKMLLRKDELTEDLPYFVDLVNLNRADPSFLRKASKHWIFLTGKQKDWMALQKKALYDLDS